MAKKETLKAEFTILKDEIIDCAVMNIRTLRKIL